MEPIPLLLMETNDSRKRDRFARRKGEEGVAYDRTDQPVSLPAVNGKRQRERERKGKNKKKKKKKGRKKEAHVSRVLGAIPSRRTHPRQAEYYGHSEPFFPR